ncbi:TetR/AcrR family transcriptional regulator [Allosalinactinospora lopnorensis]|uniref:TetR/AcrR family transcriptional regulator n=1 Tax=Allosalinactinospora lopnorensis TaxID=1352348 RepID=UPI000623BA05|nr:TetR/AcrR family transcriptional regulator [Allosalinactinospora lopnorensis]
MTKQELVDRRQREIIAVASRVFAERGYHNTGVADIARELGAGHGTFYRYFESKLDLLRHVLDHAVDRIMAALADEDPGASDTAQEYRAQVERIGAALFRLLRDDDHLVRLLTMHASNVDAEITARVSEAAESLFSLTESYLRNGVDKGFLRADLDIEITARGVNGMILLGALNALGREEAINSERWIRGFTDLMFDGITAR